MKYIPRLTVEDFGGISLPLNEAEKEYLINQIWAKLSKQSFTINLEGYEDNSEIVRLLFGYLWGFSDGYTQQFEEIDFFEFRNLLPEINIKLMTQQVGFQGDELLVIFNDDTDFDETDEHFLNAVNLGGIDGINEALNNGVASSGLTKLFGPASISKAQNTQQDAFAYQLGSKVGDVIRATKKLPLLEKYLPENYQSRLSEDELFEKAYDEIFEGQVKKGLWARAFSESNGNEKKAEAIYIKLRVQQIKDETYEDVKRKNIRQRQIKRQKEVAEQRALEKEERIQAQLRYLEKVEKEKLRAEEERLALEEYYSKPAKPFPKSNILIFLIFVVSFFVFANAIIN